MKKLISLLIMLLIYFSQTYITSAAEQTVWDKDMILGSNGKYKFAGIYEFENLTIKDNVKVTSMGISQLVIKVKGTLTLGKNVVIRVRNGFYPEAPKYNVSDYNEKNLDVLGINMGDYRIYENTFGKGGNGGSGEKGDRGSNIYRNLIEGNYSTDGGDGGDGGNGGFGGGNCGLGGFAGDGTGFRRGQSGYNGLNNAEDGAGGTDIGVLNIVSSNAYGGAGNGGNGGSHISMYHQERSGVGGGGGGYGGGILTIVANKIVYDKTNYPKFLVSGQRGGMSGRGFYSNTAYDGENGQGGMLIISCPNYKASIEQYFLDSSTYGDHISPSANGGHGVITGNPQRVFVNSKIVEEVKGFTCGNIVNNGYVAQQGDWIYYVNTEDGSTIYKIKTNGIGQQKINNNSSGFINVLGDWIYFLNWSDGGFLYRMKTDGTKAQMLSDDRATNIHVLGDWIYYENINDEYTIYRMRTDGTVNEKVCYDKVAQFTLSDGWIYYENASDMNKLYKMKTDGSSKQKLNDDISHEINVLDEWIYYVNGNSNNEIYKIKINGSGRQKICGDNPRCMNVSGQWIYYDNINDNCKLYRIKIDGSSRQKLNDESSFFINIADNWIFYFNDGVRTMIQCLMKSDGSNKQTMKDWNAISSNTTDIQKTGTEPPQKINPANTGSVLNLSPTDGISFEDYFNGKETTIKVHVGETINFKPGTFALHLMVDMDDENNLFKWVDSSWTSLITLKLGKFEIWDKYNDVYYIFEVTN